MIEYRFAKDEHRQDVIDFINYVFSQSAAPHDFKTLIPKVYADGRGYSDIHAIVLEDRYVRGVVAQLPNTFSFAGVPLKTGYIGSVSTYKYSRGSGYMIKLMNMQEAHAKELNIDIQLLGGHRQRYEYYGFSPVGGAYTYRIHAANVRHGLKNTVYEDVEFIPFDKAEETEIDEAYRIYERQPITGGRPRQDFEIILTSWNCTPYLVKEKGAVRGYLVSANPEGISEITLDRPEFIKPCLKAWFEMHKLSRLSIACPAYLAPLNREIASFAQGYEITANFAARIVNLKNVLLATLTLKKATGGLPDGKLVLKMDDETAVCAKVENGEISVYETDENADVSLDRLSMQQFLFSCNRYMAPDCPSPEGWFPLPLHLYGADHF